MVRIEQQSAFGIEQQYTFGIEQSKFAAAADQVSQSAFSISRPVLTGFVQLEENGEHNRIVEQLNRTR